MQFNLTEPSCDQCTENKPVYEDVYRLGYAIWYPQMGGYVSKAIVIVDKDWIEKTSGSRQGGCLELYIWHDGEFPFRGEDSGESPVHIHHCDPEQFISFGEKLKKLNDKNRTYA